MQLQSKFEHDEKIVADAGIYVADSMKILKKYEEGIDSVSFPSSVVTCDLT